MLIQTNNVEVRNAILCMLHKTHSQNVQSTNAKHTMVANNIFSSQNMPLSIVTSAHAEKKPRKLLSREKWCNWCLFAGVTLISTAITKTFPARH